MKEIQELNRNELLSLAEEILVKNDVEDKLLTLDRIRYLPIEGLRTFVVRLKHYYLISKFADPEVVYCKGCKRVYT